MYVEHNHIGILICVQIKPFPTCVVKSQFVWGFSIVNFHQKQIYNFLSVNLKTEISVCTPLLETTSLRKAGRAAIVKL